MGVWTLGFHSLIYGIGNSLERPGKEEEDKERKRRKRGEEEGEEGKEEEEKRSGGRRGGGEKEREEEKKVEEEEKVEERKRRLKTKIKQKVSKQKNPECRQDSFGKEGLAGSCNLTPWDSGSEAQLGSSVNLLVT